MALFHHQAVVPRLGGGQAELQSLILNSFRTVMDGLSVSSPSPFELDNMINNQVYQADIFNLEQ